MSVAVGTGEAWVPGTSSSLQSGYYCRVTSSQNLPVAAADPTNPRVDSVTATVTDKAYAGTADSFAVQVNTGVPTSGANLTNLSGAPALPTSSLLLGYVLVPAGSSSVTSGNILAQASTFSPGGGATLVTSLPVSPVDGQEIDLLVDATNGVRWRLRYRSASSSAYKWEHVGGSPMQAEVLTVEATPGTSYGDCATVGPTVVLPVGGDFDISFGCYINGDTVAGPILAAPKLGSAATSDNDSVAAYTSLIVSPARTIRRTGLVSGSTIKLQYKSPGSATTFGHRFLAVTPVRCG